MCMQRRSRDDAADCRSGFRSCLAEGLSRPAVIAVTVLTSADGSTLQAVGITNDPDARFLSSRLLAAKNGMDGLVASALEAPAIRSAVPQPGFLIVTPGIRPSGVALNDQKRVMTPASRDPGRGRLSRGWQTDNCREGSGYSCQNDCG